jgi:hypothetical protein
MFWGLRQPGLIPHRKLTNWRPLCSAVEVALILARNHAIARPDGRKAVMKSSEVVRILLTAGVGMIFDSHLVPKTGQQNH